MPRAKARGGGRKPPANRGNSRNTRGSSSLSPIKSNPSKSEQADSPIGIPDDIGTADNTPGVGSSLVTPGDGGLVDEQQGQDDAMAGFDPALLLGQMGQGGTIDMTAFEGQMPQQEGYDEEGAPDASFLDELERGLGLKEGEGEGEGVEGDVEMLDESQTGGALEAEDGEDEEDGEEGEDDDDDDDDEDGEEEGDDEDGDEDDEDADADEDDEEGDEEEDDGTQRDEWVDCPEEIIFRYPAAVPDFTTLDEREQQFKIARFMRCQVEDCTCEGLEPPLSSSPEVKEVSRDELDSGDMEELEVPEGLEEDAVEKWRSEEGWWRRCGRCGHGWEGEGHVFPAEEASGEKVRKGRVVGRIEELLQDRGMLTTFPTPQTKEVASLLKQLHHFVRPSGKKPAGPLPSAIDLASPGASGSVGTPMAGHDSDEERPRKRSRKDGSIDEVEDQDEGIATSPRHGKKPGGKSAGKGTKPRTVVRGARGLIPMEIEADGSQHPAGDLPESAKPDGGEEEDDEEDVPLAKRPELDERERKRRELAKEKAREKEDEVVRRLTKGVNVEEGAEADVGDGPLVDVEVWEGVELPKLPPRPAAIEQEKQEIMLPVVSSRNPTPVATILLIGLKNLFQRQLPKMPREYITRLVLDKNHISMAIVKRGWKVVGGICYRPFESRGFAEIVFCAVDSSEQIKGYGSHLMNALKDHVRAAHPTINHFLTYADNYAVGYFRKQGFSKEISFDRERWVGYIKDYEGGTIMQCKMLPKVKYVEVHQMLADQKAAVLAKIRTISRSHVVHPGLEIFKDRKPGQEIKLDKDDVPGLPESGWNPELDAIIRQPKRNPHHSFLQLVLDDLQNEPSAWPFLKPVDGEVVKDYYDVITEPMDLQTMEAKLENNHYSTIDDFLADAQRIFSNCRIFNAQNTYTTQANRLEKALDRIMKKRQVS